MCFHSVFRLVRGQIVFGEPLLRAGGSESAQRDSLEVNARAGVAQRYPVHAVRPSILGHLCVCPLILRPCRASLGPDQCSGDRHDAETPATDLYWEECRGLLAYVLAVEAEEEALRG